MDKDRHIALVHKEKEVWLRRMIIRGPNDAKEIEVIVVYGIKEGHEDPFLSDFYNGCTEVLIGPKMSIRLKEKHAAQMK